MNEEEIIELQTRLAYQEDWLQRLNEVIYRQQQQIDRLQVLSDELLQRVRTLAESGAAEPPEDDTPPHY